jgi:hypothetical protein
METKQDKSLSIHLNKKKFHRRKMRGLGFAIMKFSSVPAEDKV